MALAMGVYCEIIRNLGARSAPHLRGIQQRQVSLSGYSASSDQSVVVDSSESSTGSAPLELRTGHLARFADGAVVASRGESAVLATVVTKAANGASAGFTPLTVDFRQSAAAVGKIPTNYLRRELGQSDADILISRIIDRSVRPLIPSMVADQIQLHCKPLATEDDSDPVTLAVNAASAALQISPIPMLATSAAVRVALVDGKPIVNPTRAAMREATADLLLSGSDGARTLMIEMDGKEIPLELLEEAMDAALREAESVIRGIARLTDAAAKRKRKFSSPDYSTLDAHLAKTCGRQLEVVLTDSRHNKFSRDEAIKAVLPKVLPILLLTHKDESIIRARYPELVKKTIRSLILRSSVRCDGRKIDEFRPISIQVGVYKKLKGSAIFERGQTQVLSTCTLDSPSAASHLDSISQLLGNQRKKSFTLHYEFPGFAINEITVGRGGNRRELGHGSLAEKGLKHLVPAQFPFNVRLDCQVLASNGSSSMASVSGGSMALLDAGVPIKAQAAGVAIGLVSDLIAPDEKYEILTDLSGIEDYAGHMDFKMTGTTAGFTAMQLDVKTTGLTRQQLHESLIRGRSAIDRLVRRQDESISRPREHNKESAPTLESLELETTNREMLSVAPKQIESDSGVKVSMPVPEITRKWQLKESLALKNGAKAAKQIEEETGVKITTKDGTHFKMIAPNAEMFERAKTRIRELASECDETDIEIGKIITVECVGVHNSGINVKITPNGMLFFISKNQLYSKPIQHSSDIGLKVGDRLKVKWLGRHPKTDRVQMSRLGLEDGSGVAANAVVKVVKRETLPMEHIEDSVPVLESLDLEHYKQGRLCKDEAKVAKKIERETGVKISFGDDRQISLTAPNREKLERAKKMIRELTADSEETQIEFGKIITVKCVEVHDGGILVTITPNGMSYYIYNYYLHSTPIDHPSDIGLKVGDELTVQWLGRDLMTGRAQMSRRGLQDGFGVAVDELVERGNQTTEQETSLPVRELKACWQLQKGLVLKDAAMAAKQIEAETGVKISMEGGRHILVAAPNREMYERAKKMIKQLASESDETNIEIGKIITVECVDVNERGIEVKITPKGLKYFISKDKLHPTPIDHPSDIGLKIGDRLTVQWLGRESNSSGVRMSRLGLQGESGMVADEFLEKEREILKEEETKTLKDSAWFRFVL